MTTKNDFSKDLTRSDVEDQQAFEPLKVCQGDVDEKFALTTEEKKALRKILDTPNSGSTLFEQLRASGSRFPYRDVPDDEKLWSNKFL